MRNSHLESSLIMNTHVVQQP